MGLCSSVGSLLNKLYTRLKLKYAIPFVILVIYTLIGALILYSIENGSDSRRRAEFRGKVEYADHQIMERLVEIKNDSYIQGDHMVYNITKAAITWYFDFLGVEDYLNSRSAPTPWTFWGAMFYAGTIYSTIGYGSPSPTTGGGQLFTCIYALVGIPLFLIILKEVGKHLSRLLRRGWKHALRVRRSIHFKIKTNKKDQNGSESGPNNNGNGVAKGRETRIEMEEEEGEREGKRKSRLPFPMTLPLVLVFFWVFLSGAIFCIWEKDWGYFPSVYFVFISLSTIGLGDIVPTRTDLMMANFVLIVIGLALISMTFNIIQIRLEELMEDMLQEFIDDFERIAASSGKHGFEIGISSPLVSMPFGMGKMRMGKMGSAKSWLKGQLVKSQTRRRRRLSDTGSSSEEETPVTAPAPPGGDNFQQLAAKHPQGKILSKILDMDRLQELKAKIEPKVDNWCQTVNDFTELVHFLDILPKKKEADTQTLISISIPSSGNMSSDDLGRYMAEHVDTTERADDELSTHSLPVRMRGSLTPLPSFDNDLRLWTANSSSSLTSSLVDSWNEPHTLLPSPLTPQPPPPSHSPPPPLPPPPRPPHPLPSLPVTPLDSQFPIQENSQLTSTPDSLPQINSNSKSESPLVEQKLDEDSFKSSVSKLSSLRRKTTGADPIKSKSQSKSTSVDTNSVSYKTCPELQILTPENLDERSCLRVPERLDLPSTSHGTTASPGSFPDIQSGKTKERARSRDPIREFRELLQEVKSHDTSLP